VQRSLACVFTPSPLSQSPPPRWHFARPDAGQMVAGDRNDAFTGAVQDFLDRHDPI
jgi:hypothetical protein